MDPLTHTLVGASLAATRLGERTRLAGAALVVGANLPDVDALAYFAGGDASLGFRRGWTHGVPALLVLPPLLALLLWTWGKRRPSPGDSRPLAPGWLLGLSYLAVATHPALDWLNTYGMRWWMPLRDTWYYGDAVFIMDPWLWLALGGFWLGSRRPSLGIGVGFAVFALLLSVVVAWRAPGYLPAVGSVVVLLAVVLVLRPPRRQQVRTLLPAIGLSLGVLYIGALIGLQRVTEQRVRTELQGSIAVDALMVGPLPANPLRWDVVAQTGGVFRYGTFDWRSGRGLELAPERLRAARGTPTWRALETSGQIPGFRRWTRFPWLEAGAPAGDGRIYVMDARYARSRTTGFGGAAIEAP